MHVFIATSSFASYSREPLALLEKAGITYSLNPHGRKLTPEETVALAADADGILAGTESLARAVLEQLPKLRALSRVGVGMDNVDSDYCAKHSIAVANTPFGPTRAVAELTLGLVLDLMRRVTEQDRDIRAGKWSKKMGWLLQGKKVGIVGFGRIGRAVAEVMAAMGAEVAYSDPFCLIEGWTCMEYRQLLAWADIVTLHCSKTDGVCHLLGRDELSLLRPGSWLVNASRGGLVDEAALFDLLASGHLAGAAIDCFDKEPYAGPLATLPNVILTPHIGSYAREGRIQMEIDAVKNLLAALGAKK